MNIAFRSLWSNAMSTDWAEVRHVRLFDILFNLLEIPVSITDEEAADLVISSCFNQQPPVPGKRNLFFTHENSFTSAAWRKEKFGLPSFGYCADTSSSCEMPFWFLVYYQLSHDVLMNFDRLDGACSMYHVQYPHREKIISHYQADRISCGGDVILNREKQRVLSRYRYNIAVENSFYPAYVSEKIVDAVLAGCVPVYAGGDLDRTPFNQERIIPAYSPLPRHYEEFFYRPVMKENHREMFEERKEKLKCFLARIMN